MKTNKTRLKDMLAGAALTALVLGLAVPALAATGSRNVKINYDNIKVVVDGRAVALKDAAGNAVEPFTLDGTTYLPVRAMGNALGMDVGWNSATKTVTLTSRTGAAAPDESGYIGVEKAKAIALDHAGVKAADAVFFKAEWDWDDGRAEYEIEFYSGNTEYDYDIDAATGKILSWDHDAEGYYVPGGQTSSGSSSDYISLDRAKALAQSKAPSAILISCKLDWEDGRAVYEGELREGNMEYEFEIDAVTGSFLKWEADRDD